MRQFPKKIPVILLAFLVGGAGIFLINGFLPVPLETVFAIVGLLVFCVGMVASLVTFLWAIQSLASQQGRTASGILSPVSTILIGLAVWSVVIVSAVVAKKSLDMRDQQGSSGSPISRAEESPERIGFKSRQATNEMTR